MMKNKISSYGVTGIIFLITAFMSGSVFFASPAAAQLTINDSQTAEPPDEWWNNWDYTGSQIYIGFGEGASGELIVPAGADVIAGSWFLGSESPTASGYLEINGEGAMARVEPMEAGSNFYIGFDGYGEVLVTNGGQLRTRLNYTAFNPGSSGKVTVTGPDSAWVVGNNIDLRVGQQGEAILHVLDGGRVENFRDAFLGNLSVVDAGTGEVIGGGSVEILIEAGGSVIGGRLSRIGNREGTVANMTVRDAGSVYEMGDYIHLSSGGETTVLIENGGTVRAGGTMSLAAGTRATDKLGTAHVHVTGEGSLLESGSWLYVGRGGNITDEDDNVVEQWGTSATLLVDNGGAVVAGGSFRLAREPEGFGEATFTGEGTSLTVGNLVNVAEEGTGILHILDGAVVDQSGSDFFQVGRQPGSVGTLNVDSGGRINAEAFLYAGREGHGTINVTNGGVISHGSVFYVARTETGVGQVLVSGENSRVESGGSVRVGATPDLEPSGGMASVEIKDGGLISTANDFVVRGDSTVTLDGGTIELLADEETGERGVVSVGAESSLTGQGVVLGNMEVFPGALLQGTGEGIAVSGLLSGTGVVENLSLGGVRAVASVGALDLRDVVFAVETGNPLVHIVIDTGAEALVLAGPEVDYSGADVVVEFDLPLPPATTLTFPLFGGEAALNFASVTTPAGWGLQDGVLVHTGEVPVRTPFEDWAAGFGLTGDDALPGENPSGDGFSNAAKFAFGASPTMAVPALAEVEASAEGVTLRWNRLTAAGATYRIERSPTLEPGSWEKVEGAVPALVADPGAEVPEGYERVEWTAVPAEENAFYRVVSVLEPSLLP